MPQQEPGEGGHQKLALMTGMKVGFCRQHAQFQGGGMGLVLPPGLPSLLCVLPRCQFCSCMLTPVTILLIFVPW